MATLSYRDICEYQNTNQYNSRFFHRITELATLLGNNNKVGYTLGSRFFFNLLACLFALSALYSRVLLGLYRSYTRIWEHLLGK